MPNEIPTKSRQLVKARESDRCLRCPAEGSAWHHRRGRRVRDEHQHHPCNGVWLCKRCHDWCHAYPRLAEAEGFIVSRYVNQPGLISVSTYRHGTVFLSCEGSYQPNGAPSDHQGSTGSRS